jgi:hypothetical protein
MIARQIGEYGDIDAGAVEATFGNADRTGFQRAGLSLVVGKALPGSASGSSLRVS